ncbi:MAG: phosphodiester glycosidase family protein, partial [Myxococcota bacterium]|nr:phosphodiester glycosidase family protein [Myxococcota bacterium]
DHAVHYVEIDLTTPDLYLRATRETEGPLTTSEFAELTDSVATINGDWVDSENNRPLGLAVGNGWHWSDTHDWDESTETPGDWSFLACRASKECFFDPRDSYQEWNWVWQNVVGGNGDRLILDGELLSPAWDSEERPRSAICLDSTGTNLIMAVAEGDGAGASGVGAFLEGSSHTYDGFTPWDFAAYLYDLGCWQAMGLDGGGSSDLAVLGSRVNDRSPSEPDERSLYSHLSVIQAETTDSACAEVMNGRYCDGEVLQVCQGGIQEELDCGFYGWSCEEGDDTAYCVDPTCTNGGLGDACLDDDLMVQCEHGWASEFSCSAYDYTCEDTPESARCTHPDCAYGGEARWCEGDTVKSCAPEELDGVELGVPLDDVDCTSMGQVCVSGACVDPIESDTAEATSADPDLSDTGSSELSGPPDSAQSGGGMCAVTSTRSSWPLLIGVFGALLYRRRRA